MEKVYIDSDWTNNMIRARKFEQAGEWDKARQLHAHMGNTLDVAAIDMILEATRQGDEFRAKAKSDPAMIRLNIMVKVEKGEPLEEWEMHYMRTHFKG